MAVLAYLDDARLLQIAMSGAPSRFNPASISEPYELPVLENVLPELIRKNLGGASLGDRIMETYTEEFFTRELDGNVGAAVLDASSFAVAHFATKSANVSISEEGAVLLEWGTTANVTCVLIFAGDGTVVSSIASPLETFSASAREYALNDVPDEVLDRLKAIV